MNKDGVVLLIPALNPDEKLVKLVQDLKAEEFKNIFVVNDGSKKEHVHIFEKIKEMGYTAVQFFGGKDLMIRMGKAAKQVGLTCLGNLSDLDTYVAMGDELFDICREYDIPDFGISSFHSDEEEVKEFVGRVNEFAAKARAALTRSRIAAEVSAGAVDALSL